jgi:hypothetical protein
MNQAELLWPRECGVAESRMLESLQDLAVFVEDTGDERFYTHLFRRIFGGEYRIHTVQAMGGRAAVVNAAQKYQYKTPGVFLIDGDFEWVTGAPAPSHSLIVRLECYCIENLLVCDVAACRILCEETGWLPEEASSRLDWSGWVSGIRSLLVRYSAACALKHKYRAGPTQQLGLRPIVTSKGKFATLDLAKLESAVDSMLAALPIPSSQAKAEIEAIVNRADALDEPLLVVSGKSILLPLMRNHMVSAGCASIDDVSFRTRLALNCVLDRFQHLRSQFESVIRGQLVAARLAV